MSNLPACCPSTLPLIFQLGRHVGGLTKRSAGNFATTFPKPFGNFSETSRKPFSETSSFKDSLEVLWPVSSFRNVAYSLLNKPHNKFLLQMLPKIVRFCRFGCWNVQFTSMLSIYTLPLIFQLGRHVGGLTKRSAGNFATNFPIGKTRRGPNQEVCRQFCH